MVVILLSMFDWIQQVLVHLDSIIDGKEVVVLIVVKLTMDDVLHLDNWMNEDWAMNADDRDDDDSEHIVLFQQLLDRIQNYYNHLVVFVDNNLFRREIIKISFFV